MAGRSERATRARAFGRGESGQAAVLSVVWMVVLLGLAGLVIDVGSWYRAQRNLQSQADASALAGAQELPDSTATAGSVAQTYAKKNGYTLPLSGVTFSSVLAADDSISVKVDQSAPTFFAKLFGIDTVPIKAEATARVEAIGKARWVAPITVNIKHPLLSGRGCPCFDTPTALPLDKRGAPGAFGLLDLDNNGGNGSSTLGDWILHGFNDYLAAGADYSSNTGAKFDSSDIDDALTSRVGTVMLFPVFDKLTDQGTGAVYHIVAWVGFRLTGYDVHGHSGTLYGSFTEIIWEGIPAVSGGPPQPDLGVRVVTLTH